MPRSEFRALEETVPTGTTASAEAHVQALLDATGKGFLQTDSEGVITAWNAAATALLGWTGDEVIGQRFDQLITPWRFRRENGGSGPTFPAAADDGPLGPIVVQASHRNGREVSLELSIGRMWWGTHWTHHAFMQDVTARRSAELSLSRSESEHRRLAERTPDLISRHTPDGRILYASPASGDLLGMSPEELVGRDASALVHPDDLGLIIGGDGLLRTDAGTSQVAFRLRHANGNWVWVEATFLLVRDPDGRVIELQLSTRDITERMARDADFFRQSKLESLGRLSAGLAHEINSPIQYVGDNARFLAEAATDLLSIVLAYREAMDPATTLGCEERLASARSVEAAVDLEYLRVEVPGAVKQTMEGIERVATLVRAMKTISHHGSREHAFADVNEALRATLTVARHQIDSVAELACDLGDIPPVMCGIADLNQVFLNLIINAADAVEETGQRGRISVTSAMDGHDVVLRFEDTGSGVPDAILDKIFDPFFTTKDVGRGTGQGLPLARAVVTEGHGGSLSLDTSSDGTTFTVRLPIAGRSA